MLHLPVLALFSWTPLLGLYSDFLFLKQDSTEGCKEAGRHCEPLPKGDVPRDWHNNSTSTLALVEAYLDCAYHTLPPCVHVCVHVYVHSREHL